MIRLKDAEIIAAGHTRDVYRHPDDASLLIKVIRASAIATRYGRGSPWYKFKVREQIAVHAIGEPHPRFLQKIVGFVETDMGMGLVVEAVRAADGSSAPTVAALAAEGALDEVRLAALDRFLDEMVNSPVIVADLNPFNVVYGRGADGVDHFVLIDGIGHKNLIPLERMSARLNRWSKVRKGDRFRQMVAARRSASGQSATVVNR
jgi:hypothetical protein